MRRNKKIFNVDGPLFEGGYTIIEVMIFMAVSSVLAVGALRLVGGQQAKTEFAQAVRDLDLRLQDAINDVSTGYYVNKNNFTCSASPGGPSIVSGAGAQGQNKDCIVLGQVVEFGVNNGQEIRLYPVVGLRQAGSPPKDVTTLAEAQPTAIAKTSVADTVPDGTQIEALLYGLRVKSVTYDNGAGPVGVGAVGFLTSLDASVGGGLQFGSKNADLYYVDGTSLTPPDSYFTATRINALTKNMKNPSRGIAICLESGGGYSQHAIITIGSNGRQLSTDLKIIEGASC